MSVVTGKPIYRTDKYGDTEFEGYDDITRVCDLCGDAGDGVEWDSGMEKDLCYKCRLKFEDENEIQ
jgi:hypothetical protein